MTDLEFAPAKVEPEARKSSSKPYSSIHAAKVFLYPLLVVGLATTLAHIIHLQINVTALPLVVVSVMICSWKWGLLGGIWSAVLAWFGYLFFFIPPILTFYIRDEKSAVRMTELVVTSVIT